MSFNSIASVANLLGDFDWGWLVIFAAIAAIGAAVCGIILVTVWLMGGLRE